MKRYLVVANQTLSGPALDAALRQRIEAGACSFFVVVPATTPSRKSLTWTEGECVAAASESLAEALRRLVDLGVEVDGAVGDRNPMLAVLDAMREQAPFDEIIVSTLAPGVSRWLRQDLPNRIRRETGLPVAHVQAAAKTARAS
jgi:hypothetical protein